MSTIPTVTITRNVILAMTALIWIHIHSATRAEEKPTPATSGPIVEMDEEARLRVITGNWVSATGEQKASIDGRKIRFNTATHWPDLEGGAGTLAPGLHFQTNQGSYSLDITNEDRDRIVIHTYNIHADSLSFVLYREGTKHANSRKPLPETAPPAKVKSILDKIPTIKIGESRNAVMKRLGLDQDGSIERILKEEDSGQTYELLGKR